MDFSNFPEPPRDFSGVAAAGATLLLFVATVFLWRSTRSLVQETKSTAKRELRAYVFAEVTGFERVLPNMVPFVHVTFRNYGKTPAYRLTTTIQFKLIKSGEGLPAFEGAPSPTGPLGPGAQLTVTSEPTTPMTEVQYRELLAGTLDYSVYGRLAYEDAFKNKDRFVEVRLKIAKEALIGGGKGVLAVCDEGNFSDEPA